MGLVQAENIQVIGEAYDVALDISFPKGTLKQVYFLNQLSFIFFFQQTPAFDVTSGKFDA